MHVIETLHHSQNYLCLVCFTTQFCIYKYTDRFNPTCILIWLGTFSYYVNDLNSVDTRCKLPSRSVDTEIIASGPGPTLL